MPDCVEKWGKRTLTGFLIAFLHFGKTGCPACYRREIL